MHEVCQGPVCLNSPETVAMPNTETDFALPHNLARYEIEATCNGLFPALAHQMWGDEYGGYALLASIKTNVTSRND
jgi:hypothetical protein